MHEIRQLPAFFGQAALPKEVPMHFFQPWSGLWAVVLSASIAVVCFIPGPAAVYGGDLCAVNHPFKPPNMEFKGQCPNCGMGRPMWARTWKTFENSAGKFGVCSLHCLADMALKSGEPPKKVMVALFLDPKTMIPADKAFFVVGSKAKGTMTMMSKCAFASKGKAEEFVKACGGKVVSFADALKIAKAAAPAENKVIAGKRLKMGKVVNPADNKDRCPVCGMYPARYPKNRCEIVGKGKKVSHFCSVGCMVEFLNDPKKYAKTEFKPMMIWVTDYPTGAWISGRTAYYVVGSKVQGPMGPGAFAFAEKAAAEKFAKKERGKTVTFAEVTPASIKGK
jgi:nitrous oxide reductase accessory protein NosL